MHPSMRSALSRSQVKSGRTRSTPGMSGSGNMSPQSRRTMRPSSSRHAQLRPISPKPPRKVMRTGSVLAFATRSATDQPGVDLAGTVFELSRTRTDREPGLADRQAEGPHHRLGGDRTRPVGPAEEGKGLQQRGVDLAGTDDVALLEGGEHLLVLGPGPMRDDADGAHGADGEQG